MVEIYHIRKKSSEIKNRLSHDRLKGLEIKFEKFEVYMVSLSRQIRGSDFHFFEEENRKFKDLKQNFTRRTDTLLGRLEESDLFGKIDKFLLDPNLVEGVRLLDILSEKISICEEHQFLKLLKKFKTSNQNVNQTYEKLDELFEKLKILDNLFSKNEFAHVMEKLPTYKDQIINIKSSELSSKFSEISFKTQEGLNKCQFKMQKLLDEGEKQMLDNDYSGARSKVKKANIIYEKSIKSTTLKDIKHVNFSKIFESIENKEQEFTIYKILLEFADRFSRVLLLEIINKVEINPANVEKIVKKLINSGKIQAEFDEETKGIEFKFAVDEIDALMKVYGDWETRDKGKKE
jgi:predicted transcriptional regulator